MPTETIESPLQVAAQAEKAERQASFLSKLRGGIAQELKYAFTLPKPGKGLIKDIALKGAGYSGMAIGALAGEQAHAGKIYRMPGDTTQSLHRVRETLEYSGGVIAIFGAAAVFMANRVRSQRDQDDAAFQERLKNSRHR